jgi:lysophospholipase L1-like esterase
VLSAATPTITLTQATSASTIPGAVLVALKRGAGNAYMDSDADPHFQTIGAPQTKIIVDAADTGRAAFLTGGTSQAARYAPRWRFDWTGQVFGVYVRFLTGSFSYRLWVDGLPLTADFVTTAVTATQRAELKVDFGTVGRRTIELEWIDPAFVGVWIEPTASITRPNRPRLLLAGLGDSHTGGASGVGRWDTWVRRSAHLLGCDWTNLGIGGSGFLTDNGTTGANFRNRLTPDVIASRPDVLVFEGSWNDGASSSAAVGAEALYCYQQLRAALPGSILIAAGPWVVGHNLNATLDGHDDALRAAATTAGMDGYISFRDPLNLKAAAPAWAAATAYLRGDVVVRNGFAQQSVVDHTSAATFDQTKWRSTALVTGTGRVGTTAGNGSADVLVSSDGVHSTALGHEVKAAFVAAEVQLVCRTLAVSA